MGLFEDLIDNAYKASRVNTEDFPRLYVEYLAAMDGVSLEEAAGRSLARVFALFSETTRNVAIISAFRGGEFTLTQNRGRNRSLMSDIRSLGYGYTPVYGGWIESIDGSDKTRKVEEESLIVSGPTSDDYAQSAEQFLGSMKLLRQKYNQDGVLLKLAGSDTASLLNRDGSIVKLGAWSVHNASAYYTRMRKGPREQPKSDDGRAFEFQFECAGSDSPVTRQVVAAFFENKYLGSGDGTI